jgi:phage gp46-like protein
MVDVNITLRSAEGESAQPYLLWDTRWNGDIQALDWVPVGSSPLEPQNKGGLSARRPLDTAVRICLATWRRAEPYDTLPDGNDPKGWWGDSIQLDDDMGPIGSRLWLLYRSILNTATAASAVSFAQEALACLITQGVVVRFDITPTIDRTKSALALQIDGYSQSGEKIYSQTFARIWNMEFDGSNDIPNTPLF